MRKRFHDLAEKGRMLLGSFGSNRGDRFGWFQMICPMSGGFLKVIASAGDVPSEDDLFPNGTRWDHVSVSLKNRTPTWEEMAWVKSLFFDDEELVVEFHPPKSKYVNVSVNVLHLWKPLDAEIQLPPSICV